MNNNRKTVIYQISPRLGSKSGIVSFSKMLHELLLSENFLDVRSQLFGADEEIPINDVNSIHFLYQCGSSDSSVYRNAIAQQMKLRNAKRLFILHDAPMITVEPFGLERLARLSTYRAIRRLGCLLAEAVTYRRLFYSGDKIIALSEAGREAIDRRLARWTKVNVTTHVLRHPLYCGQRLRANWGLQKRIGFLGFVAPRKGLDFLGSVLTELRQKFGLSVALDIYGSFSGNEAYHSRLRRQFKRDGIADLVTFKGYLADSDIQSVFKSFDFLATPYPHNRTISASGPIATAFTFGVPVLASNILPMAEYVHDNVNGYLLPARDRKAWIEKLMMIYSDPAEYQLLKSRTNAFASAHDWSFTVQQFAKIVGVEALPVG